MAVVTCPSCGRLNLADELAARGFACELCRQRIPLRGGFPEDASQGVSPDPPPPARERPLPEGATQVVSPDPPPPARERPLALGPLPQGKGVYPVSKVCPNCGHTEHKKRRPERLVAFTWDRVCRACETRYTPPTPIWAAVVFLAIGFPMAGFGFISLIAGLVRGGVLGIPGMACNGFIGILGVLSIAQGFRALGRPGKA
jgi:hypothetical protein